MECLRNSIAPLITLAMNIHQELSICSALGGYSVNLVTQFYHRFPEDRENVVESDDLENKLVTLESKRWKNLMDGVCIQSVKAAGEKKRLTMISVIVPVYKVVPYLRQCIESIINQTYRDIEILLIDDGSPDECGEICEEYKERDHRVRVFHTENHGLSAARNLGLQYAKGEYIGFIDSDDWIEPEMYEVLLRRLREAEYEIIVCGYDIISDKKTTKWKPVEKVCDHDDALASLVNQKINNTVWNKLYSKELLQRSEVNDVLFPEGKNYEDVAVMHRIVDNAKSVAIMSETLYHYRIRPGSITKTYTAKNLIDYAEARLDCYYYFKNEHPKLYEEKKEKLLLLAITGISKVWRWWYGCQPEEKQEYNSRIKELLAFTKDNVPLFGYCSWPISMRLSALFMHSKSNLSFAILYALNQIYRRLLQYKDNTD